MGVTSCYFIAANGSDSNDGLSEASGHPWAHAPGMPNCAGNCASLTPAAGTGFIFRGGDTWHFGNSSVTPYAGGRWSWNWNGNSSNPQYIGVDQSWFSGASWARPILHGDNPLSAAGNLTPVASCAFQVPGGNNFVQLGTNAYVAFDNFEFTGMCQSDRGQPFGVDYYIGSGNNTSQWWLNLYFHGWSSTCSSASDCNANGNVIIFLGGPHIWYNVIDGADSYVYPSVVFNPGAGMYDVAYNVIRYATQMIGNDCHLFHDNLVEHWGGAIHPNVYECLPEKPNSTGAFYNNVIRDICTDASFCYLVPVQIWPNPPTTTTDYFFNNVVSQQINATGLQYFNIGQNNVDQGPLEIFNNTWEFTYSGTNFSCSATGNSAPFTGANNHYITDNSGGPYASNCSSQVKNITNNTMSHATATTDGYTSSQTYGYSPSSSSSPTVGAGTNESSFCSALSAAASSDATLNDAATACLYDTRYAVSYNSTNHTVSSPGRTVIAHATSGAWSVGAYEYGDPPPPPNPPTGLTAVVQ